MCYWAVNRVYYYPGASWQGGNDKYLRNYLYNDYDVYHPDVDNHSYGKSSGLQRRNIVGNGLNSSAENSGSRSARCEVFGSNSHPYATARGCNKNVQFSSIILGR